MESLVFLIPTSLMPPAGFITRVLMSCFLCTSYYTRISFLMALPCVTLIVYLTISCFIHKWFVLYIMTLCCTCKELQFVSVLFDHVQCTSKGSVLSAHFMLLCFETFCTNHLHYEKFMECRVLCISEFFYRC